MNRGLPHLQPYPFERLDRLLVGQRVDSAEAPISLAVGEPQNETPAFIHDALRENLSLTSRYPATRGGDELREAIAGWLTRRYALAAGAVDPMTQVLPVSGTREALFALAQTVVTGRKPAVAMPNPFYQIYEGAAVLTGAEPVQIPCDAETGLPDLDAVSSSHWNRIQIFYLNSPANPTGGVADQEYYEALFRKSDYYGFVIAADECYADIYADESAPATGILEASSAARRDDFKNVIAFHSLSKRSNAPGLRSGFAAGDSGLLHAFLRYRTYQGCAMPLHVQAASAAAWRDDEHTAQIRQGYRDRLRDAVDVLGDVLEEVRMPAGGFCLWPRTPIPDEAFAAQLWAQEHVRVLPGSYLSRTVDGENPGAGRVRLALVPDHATCHEAMERIRRFAGSL